MKHLVGFREYLTAGYDQSVFQRALAAQDLWEFRLHSHRVERLRVTTNLTHDLQVDTGGRNSRRPAETARQAHVSRSASRRSSVPTSSLTPVSGRCSSSPFCHPRTRRHVKNKSLFVLMKDREVAFFTLLEGEIVRGIVSDFSRYDITVHIKGGLPVVLSAAQHLRSTRQKRALLPQDPSRTPTAIGKRASTIFPCNTGFRPSRLLACH